MSRTPIDLPLIDEFDAALLDCIKEYRKGLMGSVTSAVQGGRRTRAGYVREYICVADIHAALENRGIKKAKSTVSRRVKEFIERERRAFEIGVWIDEMHHALQSVEELADRMNPEWHKEHRETIDRALSLIRKVVQPWALDQARLADNEETLARLVRYSSEYFGPGARADKPKTPPKPGIVN